MKIYRPLLHLIFRCWVTKGPRSINFSSRSKSRDRKESIGYTCAAAGTLEEKNDEANFGNNALERHNFLKFIICLYCVSCEHKFFVPFFFLPERNFSVNLLPSRWCHCGWRWSNELTCKIILDSSTLCWPHLEFKLSDNRVR